MGNGASQTLTNIENSLKKNFQDLNVYLSDVSSGKDCKKSKSDFENSLNIARQQVNEFISNDRENTHLTFLSQVQLTLSMDISSLINLDTMPIDRSDLSKKVTILTSFIKDFHKIAQEESLWHQVKSFFSGFSSHLIAIGGSAIRKAIGQ